MNIRHMIAALALVSLAFVTVQGEATCRCTREYVPVCDTATGETYDNRCLAGCSNVTDAQHGACGAADGPQIDTMGSTDAFDCMCPSIFLPVCGSDGKTYTNVCEAACKDVSIEHVGSCDGKGDSPGDNSTSNSTCGCLDVWNPMCGSGNNTFANLCELRCAKKRLIYPGECSAEPDCSDCAAQGRITVCGPDGQYGNPCYATCRGVDEADLVNGTCKAVGGTKNTCGCPDFDFPVCGGDNNTYRNPCEAMCAGAPITSLGRCGQSDCVCDLMWAPVCGANKRTYPNDCFATCAGQKDPTPGECTFDSPFKDPSSDCYGAEDVEDPVCVLRKGADTTKTYQNPCYARIAGVDLSAGDRVQRGACNDTCDAQCLPGAATTTTIRRHSVVGGAGAGADDDGSPYCCGGSARAQEFLTQCHAECLWTPDSQDSGSNSEGSSPTGAATPYASGNDAGSCTKGLCSGLAALKLLTSTPCPPKEPIATCLIGDPCKHDTCPPLSMLPPWWGPGGIVPIHDGTPGGSGGGGGGGGMPDPTPPPAPEDNSGHHRGGGGGDHGGMMGDPKCVNIGSCTKFVRLFRLPAVCGTYWVDKDTGDLIPGCGSLLP